MSKKQGKIQILEELFLEGGPRDPDFMVKWILKPLNIEESDPILRLFFCYCKIFEKNFFLVGYQSPQLSE